MLPTNSQPESRVDPGITNKNALLLTDRVQLALEKATGQAPPDLRCASPALDRRGGTSTSGSCLAEVDLPEEITQVPLGLGEAEEKCVASATKQHRLPSPSPALGAGDAPWGGPPDACSCSDDEEEAVPGRRPSAKSVRTGGQLSAPPSRAPKPGSSTQLAGSPGGEFAAAIQNLKRSRSLQNLPPVGAARAPSSSGTLSGEGGVSLSAGAARKRIRYLHPVSASLEAELQQAAQGAAAWSSGGKVPGGAATSVGVGGGRQPQRQLQGRAVREERRGGGLGAAAGEQAAPGGEEQGGAVFPGSQEGGVSSQDRGSGAGEEREGEGEGEGDRSGGSSGARRGSGNGSKEGSNEQPQKGQAGRGAGGSCLAGDGEQGGGGSGGSSGTDRNARNTSSQADSAYRQLGGQPSQPAQHAQQAAAAAAWQAERDQGAAHLAMLAAAAAAAATATAAAAAARSPRIPPYPHPSPQAPTDPRSLRYPPGGTPLHPSQQHTQGPPSSSPCSQPPLPRGPAAERPTPPQGTTRKSRPSSRGPPSNTYPSSTGAQHRSQAAGGQQHSMQSMGMHSVPTMAPWLPSAPAPPAYPAPASEHAAFTLSFMYQFYAQAKDAFLAQMAEIMQSMHSMGEHAAEASRVQASDAQAIMKACNKAMEIISSFGSSSPTPAPPPPQEFSEHQLPGVLPQQAQHGMPTPPPGLVPGQQAPPRASSAQLASKLAPAGASDSGWRPPPLPGLKRPRPSPLEQPPLSLAAGPPPFSYPQPAQGGTAAPAAPPVPQAQAPGQGVPGNFFHPRTAHASLLAPPAGCTPGDPYAMHLGGPVPTPHPTAPSQQLPALLPHQQHYPALPHPQVHLPPPYGQPVPNAHLHPPPPLDPYYGGGQQLPPDVLATLASASTGGGPGGGWAGLVVPGAAGTCLPPAALHHAALGCGAALPSTGHVAPAQLPQQPPAEGGGGAASLQLPHPPRPHPKAAAAFPLSELPPPKLSRRV